MRLSFPHLFQRLARARRRRALSVWPPHSRLFLMGDEAQWVLNWELRALGGVARSLGIEVGDSADAALASRQSVFFPSIYQLLSEHERYAGWRLGAAWFHGRSGGGEPEFDRRFEAVRRLHPRIDRLQVSNRAFREAVLETGIDPAKVHLIPIGIDLKYFPMVTPEARFAQRQRLNIPRSAVVVGSFQKDGNGWGEGLEPKLIKGPDVFLKAVEGLRARVPELFVLLSGPARGYVKAGLERLGIPYKHVFCENYPDIVQLYYCLDLYLVTSREEGGPKAVLESMATGVPLVSTRVGQAVDLVRHGENGWLAGVGEVDEVIAYSLKALECRDALAPLLQDARRTAEANGYQRQTGLWRAFMDGFVVIPPAAGGREEFEAAP